MEPIDEITADLDWRETELGLLKIFLQRKDITPRQHAVLARAAWSLLYAHYEGFCKFCLTLFFERAAVAAKNCQFLPIKTREFALLSELKRIRQLPNSDLLTAIETFGSKVAATAPKFPEVDTKSNLWPSTLDQLLELADIKCSALNKNRLLLNALVGKRNGIAHGEAVTANYSDYLRHENAAYEVMYELALLVDARLRAPPYT